MAIFFFGRRLPLAAWALEALVALGAVFPLVVMLREGGVFVTVIFGVLSLTPFIVMALVVLAAARLSRAALVVVVPGVLALGCLGLWALSDFSIQESSTASLIFVVLPFYQLGVVALTVVVAGGVYLLVRWRRVRRPPLDGGRAW